MKHIVSFSGGKDSTGMLLKMVDEGMTIDEIVFIDTGMEFPEIYNHIEKVSLYINRKITVLKPKHTYEYYLGEHVKKNGQIGYGHPDWKNRWCTQVLKKDVIKRYFREHQVPLKERIEYHGIAYDEQQRAKKNSEKIVKYPLINFKMTGKDALRYSYDKGFDFGGLYNKFVRVSCWCCPLKRLGEMKVLYLEYPQLWKKLKEMDAKSRRRFRMDYTLEELEAKFESKRNQLNIF